MRAGYDALRRRFAEALDEALKADTAETWCALDDALQVPFLDLPAAALRDLPRLGRSDRPLRIQLLEEARKIGRRLLVDFTHQPDGPATPTEAARAPADDGARRQGRMALAVLGRRAFDEGRQPGTEDFEQARQALGTTGGAPPPPRLGERVGRLWGERPAEIVRLLGALKLEAGLDEVLVDLRRVDRLARQLDGAGADRLARHVLPRHLARAAAPPLSRAQMEAYRKLLVRSLLLAQARRTLDDHWYAERPDAEPYYRVAGLAYVADARQMDPLGLLRPDALEDLEQALRRPDGLRLEGPGQGVVTDERDFDVEYRVRTDPGAPPRRGIPVVWTEAGPGLRAVSPPGARRMALRLGDDPDPRLSCRLESRLPTDGGPQLSPRPQPTAVTVRGLFRGQRLDLETRVDLHPVAQILLGRHPMPERGRIAVRADDAVFQRFGAGRGAIAVVLDCSGSMGAPQGEPFSAATKYAAATRALERVLREIPAGATVGLYLFGAAEPGYREVPAEQTIRTIQPLTPWNPDDPAQLRALMDRVEYPRAEPWNETPIVRTLMQARADLLALRDPGFKTILVLTDGKDTRFERDRALNPEQKDLPTFLRDAFDGAGIQVNLVGFRLSAGEAEDLWGQFQVLSELNPPGRFYTADDLDELVAMLREGMRQELAYRVVGEDYRRLAGISATEVAVGRLGAEERWFPGALPPGGYKLRVQADRLLETSFALDGGDLLLITLADRGGAVGFERGLFSEEYYPFKPAQLDGDQEWRLSALQNQRPADGSLRMLVTLEKRPRGPEATVRQVRPREVWFEVTPDPGAARPVALRWSNREGYPAPSWELHVVDWPSAPGTDAPARPTLRAWWSPDREAPPFRTLRRGADFAVDRPGDLPRRLPVEGGDVVLESVRIEEHPVETAAGVRSPKPCLVVRLSHPPGRPIWVRPRALDVAGQEHRFYAAVDKYTGLFWTQTRDEALAAVAGLDLIALDAFKALCAQEGRSIELPLDAPQADDALPPVLESLGP